MDLLLVTKNNIWDIEVHNGNPKVISEDNEKVQRAYDCIFYSKRYSSSYALTLV